MCGGEGEETANETGGLTVSEGREGRACMHVPELSVRPLRAAAAPSSRTGPRGGDRYESPPNASSTTSQIRCCTHR